jgi:hypothetical protein
MSTPIFIFWRVVLYVLDINNHYIQRIVSECGEANFIDGCWGFNHLNCAMRIGPICSDDIIFNYYHKYK